MSEYKCPNCSKELNKGDKVYEDRYFFENHCSWECLVEYMSGFFHVKKGEMIVLGEEE